VAKWDLGSYRVLNSRKGVLTADLRSVEGLSLLRSELRAVNVLLLGVRPPTARAWRLTPDALSDFSNLTVGWITAYGTDGPYSHAAGHDINAAALSGVAWVEGVAQQRGVAPIRTPIADFAAGLFLVVGVLDALLQRAGGAHGLLVREVSMAEAGLAALSAWAPDVLAGVDEALEPTPFYGIYASQDGIALALGALSLAHQALLRKMYRLAGGRWEGELSQKEVAELIASKSAESWLGLAQQEGLGISPVNSPTEVMADAHLQQRLMVEFDRSDPWQRLLYPVLHRSEELQTAAAEAKDLRQLLFPWMGGSADPVPPPQAHPDE
jgi:crotonobetainyl-CoA:carnitine CoA-transferase CaiB-like acyl-CoA transferase